jgi:hypothetical protein
VYFELAGELSEIEAIAKGISVRERARLRKQFGRGRWRKLKGVALVRLSDGSVHRTEVHWYKAHGIGRRKMKIKRFLDDD